MMYQFFLIVHFVFIMIIYHNDGSSVLISTENGKVKVIDSSNKGTSSIREANYFLSLIILGESNF